MDSKNPHSYYKVTPQKKNQRPMNGTHLFCVFKAFGDCHSFPSSHLARRPVWQIDSEDPSRIGGSEAANITWGRWGSLKPFATRRQGRCRFHQEPGNLKKKKICMHYMDCLSGTNHPSLPYGVCFTKAPFKRCLKVDRMKILCKESAWSIVSQFVYKLYIYM